MAEGGTIEEAMQNILIILIALKQYIKQYHWQAKSYQEHILADKLEEGLEDYIDEVAELSVVIDLSDESLKANVLLGKASLYLEGKGKADLLNIAQVLSDLGDEIDRVNDKAEAIGIKDLCGRLSNSLLRKIYLIQLQAK